MIARTKSLPMWLVLLLMFAFAAAHQLTTLSLVDDGAAWAQDADDDDDDDDDDEFDDADLAAGISVDAARMLKVRDVAPAAKLREMRQRMTRSAQAAKKEGGLVFISLPRAFAEARDRIEGGGELGGTLKHLAGLVQIKYVFVYPDRDELVIAGPWEPVDDREANRPIGKASGRPVVQMPDLLEMMRLAAKGTDRVGCSLDPDPESMKRVNAVTRKYGAITRNERRSFLRELKEAMGDQRVRLWGLSDSSRSAVAFLAADYLMKRQALGLDPIPVRGMTHAVTPRAKAAGRFWFEPAYEPIRMSQDGRVYELSGARLQVKSGKLMFQEGGAPRKAKAFAANFTKHMDALAAAEPAYADLQNLVDLFLLAHLIEGDRLDEVAGWDWAWARSAKAFPTPRFRTPETAETLISATSGSIAVGGVSIRLGEILGREHRITDASEALRALLPELPEAGWHWYEAAPDARARASTAPERDAR